MKCPDLQRKVNVSNFLTPHWDGGLIYKNSVQMWTVHSISVKVILKIDPNHHPTPPSKKSIKWEGMKQSSGTSPVLMPIVWQGVTFNTWEMTMSLPLGRMQIIKAHTTKVTSSPTCRV